MNQVTISPFNIIGITIKTCNNDHNKLSNDMHSLWNKFMSENIMDKIPDKISNDIYCIYTDYEGDYTKPYTALLGCKVETLKHLPDSLTGRSFNGGKYIKNTAKGNILQGMVFEAWTKIWKMDISRSYTADFEVYGERAQNPQDAELEIFVGIK